MFVSTATASFPSPHALQACRTEAEYAFQQRKRIVPIIMEVGYKPSGWLGALMGTRLYFDMSDVNRVPSKVPSLIKVRVREGVQGLRLMSVCSRGEYLTHIRVCSRYRPKGTMPSLVPTKVSSLTQADVCESTPPSDPDLPHSFTALTPMKELGPAGRVVIPEDIAEEASTAAASTTTAASLIISLLSPL